MKYRHIFGWGSLWLVLLLVLLSQSGYTQTGGFITPLSMDTTGVQEALPPGAVYEGAHVRHVIAPRENLHVLAAYYYDDPRQWQRIYRENRNVIRNPNRLPVGQTLSITVGESWQPAFPYQEWLQLAHRNGVWQPGQWQRAAATDGQPTSAVQPTPPPERSPTPRPSSTVQTPAAEPPAPETPPIAETPPVAEATPTAAPTPQETPTEQPEATRTPAETTTEKPETEQAPAF